MTPTATPIATPSTADKAGLMVYRSTLPEHRPIGPSA